MMLPELRVTVPARVAVHWRHRYLGFDGTTPACAGCTAQRTGERTRATVWSHHHDAVCLRHRRWVGSPAMPRVGQLDLHAAPDVVRANRHHRRIVERFGGKSVAAVFIWAVTMVDDWQRRGALQVVRERARGMFQRAPDFVSSTAPQMQAAQYPLAVHLAGMITKPGWLSAATSGPPGWRRAAPEIAEQITLGYFPTTANHSAFVRLRLNPDICGASLPESR